MSAAGGGTACWQPEAEQKRPQASAERDGHFFLRALVELVQALRQAAMAYARKAVHCALLNRGGNPRRLSVDFRYAFGEGL